MTEKDIERLKKFLYDANKHGWAMDAPETKPQRPGFKEIEYREEDWYYRDSYAGFYCAPGQEVVYFQNKPVWVMSYGGGMLPDYHSGIDLAHRTFDFLKEALLAMDKDKPFRGPEIYKSRDWTYISEVNGDIADFHGREKIFFGRGLVFQQRFDGWLIVDED